MAWPVIEKIIVVSLVLVSTIYIMLWIYKAVFARGKASGCSGCSSSGCCPKALKENTLMTCADPKGCRDHDGTSSK